MQHRKANIFFFAFSLIFLTAYGAEKTFDAAKVSELRAAKKYVEAERMLKPYASPAKFETLGASQKVEFLNGLLELAHARALKGDVAGALALLNWAEDRSEPYFRAVACVKYAEILSELEEYERARAYLKNADAIINPKLKGSDSGVAIGQGGKTADTVAAWRELAERSLLLSSNLEYGELQKKFGATYAAYVKLRRLQRNGRNGVQKSSCQKALDLADEIVKDAPDSVFAAAAKYLKGEIMASRLTEDSPQREIAAVKDYLLKLTKDRKNVLYRGEALMLLGKISLEIEWNAKDAEKYYSAALAHFREARARRDALSLYAPMNDDLKRQTAPTQKLTVFNEWKRTVLLAEDPLRLYNSANAPAWYLDDKERDCLFLLGFLLWTQERYDEAMKKYDEVRKYAPELSALTEVGSPNDLSRLLASCEVKQMMFPPANLADVKGVDLLKIHLGQFYCARSCFDDSVRIYAAVLRSPQTSIAAKACAMFGSAESLELNNDMDLLKPRKYWLRLLADKRFEKTAIYPEAIYRTGANYESTGDFEAAAPYFVDCIKRFPKSSAAESSLFKQAAIAYLNEGLESGRRLHNLYLRKYPSGEHITMLDWLLKEKIRRGEK